MIVTVLKDGPRLLWSCGECPEKGLGLDALHEHADATGHDMFANHGNAGKKEPW